MDVKGLSTQKVSMDIKQKTTKSRTFSKYPNHSTFDGEYLSIDAMRSMASGDAFGMSSFNDCGLHYGKLYPTVLASYYPSGHSSLVGVPRTLQI